MRLSFSFPRFSAPEIRCFDADCIAPNCASIWTYVIKKGGESPPMRSRLCKGAWKMSTRAGLINPAPAIIPRPSPPFFAHAVRLVR